MSVTFWGNHIYLTSHSDSHRCLSSGGGAVSRPRAREPVSRACQCVRLRSLSPHGLSPHGVCRLGLPRLPSGRGARRVGPGPWPCGVTVRAPLRPAGAQSTRSGQCAHRSHIPTRDGSVRRAWRGRAPRDRESGPAIVVRALHTRSPARRVARPFRIRFASAFRPFIDANCDPHRPPPTEKTIRQDTATTPLR